MAQMNFHKMGGLRRGGTREGGLWGSAEAFRDAMLEQGNRPLCWVIEFELLGKETDDGKKTEAAR